MYQIHLDKLGTTSRKYLGKEKGGGCFLCFLAKILNQKRASK